MIVGGRTSDLWSNGILTPLSEEIFKLLPLFFYLFVSRRATSLSLVDYALIGAASGAGFQFIEETVRRFTPGFWGYGDSLFGQVIHWNFFDLFPGYFEDSIAPLRMTSSHAVVTAFIALGIGIAVRLHSRIRGFSLIVPFFLFFLGTLDHIAWNGEFELPRWVFTLHDVFGNGYATKPFLLTLLLIAIAYDYWALNRIRSELPVLPKEKVLQPFSEIWEMVHSFVVERYKFWYLLSFYRERRELGFTILYGNEEGKARIPTLREKVTHGYIQLMALVAMVLLLFTFSWFIFGGQTPEGTCFACLFEGLQYWWDGLEWYEKGFITLGAFALTFPLLGFWAAVGAAATATGVAESGRTIGDLLRHPNKLRSPEIALATATYLGLNLLPWGRIAKVTVLRSAPEIIRLEVLTKAGLRYRTTRGSKGELLSLIAKIEPQHIGTGSKTNPWSRKFAKLLGRETDDAGHALARILGGPGGKRSGNIFPQDPNINRVNMKEFELWIVKQVEQGKDVFIRVVPKYTQGSTRPFEILYQVRVNGKTAWEIFPNP